MDKTVFLYLDAFKYGYLAKTKFMKELSEKSICGNTKIIPLHQFEFTIFSGKLPKEHGLWAWYCLDPLNSPYKWMKPFLSLFRPIEKIQNAKGLLRFFISGFSSMLMLIRGETRLVKVAQIPLEKACLFGISAKKAYVDKNPMESRLLFDYLREKGISYIASEFPFASENGSKKLDLLLANSENYDFLFVHLWKLDSIMHRFGTGSNEALGYLQELDSMIESFISRLSEKYTVRVIACSDHGMVDIKKYLDVDELIMHSGMKEGVDYEKFYDSMMARFWCKGENAFKAIRRELEKSRDGKVFTKEEAGKLMASGDRKIFSDMLFVAKEGVQLLPNYFDGFGKTKAQHGYIQESSDMDGMLMFYGEGIEARKLKDIGMLDMLPSALDFMGIKPEKGLQGKSLLKK